MKSQVPNQSIGRRVAAVVASGLVAAGSVTVGVPVAEAQDDVGGFREVKTDFCDIIPGYEQLPSAWVPASNEYYHFIYPTQEEVDSFIEVDWVDVEKYRHLVSHYEPGERPALHFAESSGEYYYESLRSRPNPDGSKNPLYFRRITESDYVPWELLDIPDVPFDQASPWPTVKPGLIPEFSRWAPLDERLEYFLSQSGLFELRRNTPSGDDMDDPCIPYVWMKRTAIRDTAFRGNMEPGDGARGLPSDYLLGNTPDGARWAKVDESSELLYWSTWSIKNLDTGETYRVVDSDEPIKEPDWDAIDWWGLV